jgi:hypothetical protein
MSIDELLERARVAGNDRIEWRDRLVAHGAPALQRIAPWLEDPILGFFAVIVIEPIGRSSHAALAVRTLREGRKLAPDAVRIHIDAAITRLGGKAPPTPRAPRARGDSLPAGIQLMAGYRGSAYVHHVVADRLPTSPTPWGDLYLTSCGWAFNCRHAIESGR